MDSVATRLFDAHFHLRSYLESGVEQGSDALASSYQGLVSCHDPEDFAVYAQARDQGFTGLRASFGIHPQWPVRLYLDYMEDLAAQGQLHALGECGFDFFEGRSTEAEEVQAGLFSLQIQLALRYNLPLVVHLRRATDMVFRYKKELSRLAAVIFHSWPGPVNEAQALRKAGINAYFSLGTTLLWDAPKALATLRCMARDPAFPILVETDMPWQPIRGKTRTGPEDLLAVHGRVARELAMTVPELAARILENLLVLGMMDP